jgi:hypothetical protein
MLARRSSYFIGGLAAALPLLVLGGAYRLAQRAGCSWPLAPHVYEWCWMNTYGGTLSMWPGVGVLAACVAGLLIVVAWSNLPWQGRALLLLSQGLWWFPYTALRPVVLSFWMPGGSFD